MWFMYVYFIEIGMWICVFRDIYSYVYRRDICYLFKVEII